MFWTELLGMEGVPSTIDVEKFAEARAFEIKAMQDAMKNASYVPVIGVLKVPILTHTLL